MRYTDITGSPHEELVAKEKRFFAAVAAEVLTRVPDAVEILLHGSRATGESKRTSDWDFIAYVADMPSERRVDLHDRRNKNGLATLVRIAGRKVDVQAESLSDIDDGFNRIARSEGLIIWRRGT